MPKASVCNGESVVEVDPTTIYFTFSRIRPRFSCGRTIQSTLEQFAAGELKPHNLPLLLVFTDGTHMYSQNNRRLYMYKQLHAMGKLTSVPVRLKPLPKTKRMATKYTPEKCALVATLMREAQPGCGEEAFAGVENGEIDEDDVDVEEDENADVGTHEEIVKEAQLTITSSFSNNGREDTKANLSQQKELPHQHQQQQQHEFGKKSMNRKAVKQRRHCETSDDFSDDGRKGGSGGRGTLENELRALGLNK